MKSIKDFNPNNPSEVRKIINDCDTWDGYEGVNIDGDSVIMFVSKLSGLVIKTRHSSKPKWWECVGFDVDGYQETLTYEPVTEV